MNLDDPSIYKKIDPAGVNRSIEFLPDQIRQAMDDARLIKIPKEYAKISRVVVSGMGGSNIGARILKSSFSDSAKAPILINAGYEAPEYIDKETLFILSSYSGTTEETLHTYKKAKKKQARIAAITSNGKKNRLARLMIKDNIPGYIFDPRNNPSGQPRLGLGYTLFGTAVIMAKAGIFKIPVKEMEKIIAGMEIRSRKLRPSSPAKSNAAKRIALKLEKKLPTLVAAEHLKGNLRALRNQMSENSKQLPGFLDLPDLNHFAMEGLAFPKTNPKNRIFVFFDSCLYKKKIQKRSRLTKDIVKKNGIEFIGHILEEEKRLAQNFELLQLGTWITYYLGALNKADPAKIPFVDWFKEQLK